MALINEQRCPQCASTVPTKALWPIAGTNRLGLLKEHCGIVCPHCGIHLRVLQSRVILVQIASILVAALLIVRASVYLKDQGALTVLMLVIFIPFRRISSSVFTVLRTAWRGERFGCG